MEKGIEKFSIFIGTFFILIMFFILSQFWTNITGQVVNYYFLIIGTAVGVVAFSAIVFYGISLVICPVLISNGKEKRNNVDSALKNKSKASGKIIIISGCLLLLCSPLIVIDYIGGFGSCGGFEVHKLDPSSIHEGNIIHLSENDFREFPKLGNIVKATVNLQETCSGMYNSQTCIGVGVTPAMTNP